MTQPTAMVTAFLAWSLLAFPSGYSMGDNTAEATAAVRWGAEYLMKLFRPTTGTTYAAGATIIYQVMAHLQDRQDKNNVCRPASMA